MKHLLVMVLLSAVCANALAFNCRSHQRKSPEQAELCRTQSVVQVMINETKYLPLVESFFTSKQLTVKLVTAFEPHQKSVSINFSEDYGHGASCAILVKSSMEGLTVTYPASQSSSWGSKGDCDAFFTENLKNAFAWVL